MVHYTQPQHPVRLALDDLEHQANRLGHLAEGDPDEDLRRAILTTARITNHRIFRLSSDLREAAREVAA